MDKDENGPKTRNSADVQSHHRCTNKLHNTTKKWALKKSCDDRNEHSQSGARHESQLTTGGKKRSNSSLGKAQGDGLRGCMRSPHKLGLGHDRIPQHEARLDQTCSTSLAWKLEPVLDKFCFGDWNPLVTRHRSGRRPRRRPPRPSYPPSPRDHQHLLTGI